MRHVVALALLLVFTLAVPACNCTIPPPAAPLPACVLKDKTIDCAKSSGLWTTQEALQAAGELFKIIVDAATGSTAWQADLQTWLATTQLPHALDFVLCDAPAIEAYFAALLKGEKGAPPAGLTAMMQSMSVEQAAVQVHDRVAWIKAAYGPKATVSNFVGMQVIVR